MERYFHRVRKQATTIFWINNPSNSEADLAIAEGAIGCTCNPSFCDKMLDHPEEGAHALGLLDGIVGQTEDDGAVESELQRRLALPILEKFRPFYLKNPTRDGFVSLQGDPIREEDPEVIVREARSNRTVAPNVCCKIPVTRAGLTAMATLMAEDTPINATEVMSVAQAITLCETYKSAAESSGRRPVLFISHIAGIFDDYLQKYVERERIDISPDALWQAGLAVARKVFQILQERDYDAIFIAGGARGLHHFTELVGGNLIVTINWSGTADKLIESNPPVVSRMFNPVPHRVIAELMEKLPDFRKAYLEDGLVLDEYGEFGPVEHFRHMFIKSWKRVLEIIAERRKYRC